MTNDASIPNGCSMAIDFHRVEDAFQAVLSSQSNSRETALDAACGSDSALRAEVVVLLASHDNASDFLQRPVTESLAEELSSGHEVHELTHWLTQRSLIDSPHGAASNSQTGNADTIAGQSIMATYEATETPLLVTTGGMLGEFEILEVIGTGGMGIVVKARDTQLDRIVALKIMKPFLALDPTARTRFLQEARSAAKIVHPNVVTVHAVREAGSISYLVMELVEGQTLDQRIAAGSLEAAEIVRISRQAALGLAAAHKRGIIHRDIKPANILLLTEGLEQPGAAQGDQPVKISDFGLARLMTEGALTQSGVIIGTPQYMSPEQALGEPLDQRSDLFSLGSVMYAMCTGRAAFQADSIMGIMRRVSDRAHAPIASLNSQVPAWLIEIVDRLLAKQPVDRIQSAGELAQMLVRGTAPGPVEPAPAAVQQPARSPAVATQTLPQPRRPRIRTRNLGLLLASLLLAAGVFVIITKDGQYELTTDDPQITAMIGEQGGIAVEDRKTGRTYFLKRGANRLAAGHYDLVVTTPDGLDLETPKFQITRFGKPVATAIARSARAVAADKSAEAPNAKSAARRSADQVPAVLNKSPPTSVDEWTEPVNLGRPVNSPGYESGAHVSADGLTLLFQAPRERDERTGPLQLWQSKRSSPAEPFGEPERLGQTLNGAFVCVDPSQTADGLVLVFGSERPEGHGGADIWMSVRESADLPWPAPFCLGPEINSIRGEWEPEVSPDGLTLYFHSDRHDGFGGTDIWTSRRESRDQPWAAAVNLGPGVNTSDSEGGAALADGGLTLVFHRVRTGRVDLWHAARATAAAEFGEARPLLPDSFTDGMASSLALSADGNELYFTMSRAAGQGGPDLWISRRTRHIATAARFALAFDGEASCVHIPTLSRNDGSPATLECWVQPQYQDKAQVVALWAGGNLLEIAKSDGQLFPIEGDAPFSRDEDNPAYAVGVWKHIAVVSDQQEVRFYVNGTNRVRLIRQEGPVHPVLVFDGVWIGAHPRNDNPQQLSYYFQGQIDELRLSRGARYHDDFVPAVRFEPDGDTAALYHFDEGTGDVLKDSSGNERHGKITAPRWVPARRPDAATTP